MTASSPRPTEPTIRPLLRAGAARADITPPVGMLHGNWGAQLHTRAEGVDQPLFATALAVEDGVTGERVVLVDVDLLHFPFAIASAARAAVARLTGIPESHVRVSATHTHSGPVITHTWMNEGRELVEPYVVLLTGKIAGAAWEALRHLRPARVAAGAGSCDLAVNRRQRLPDGRIVAGRNPDGFVDRTVRVLRIDDADEHPIAAVVHYACHPTIMAWENRLFTPDYPGETRRTVERVTGATCLFLQGCAGDAGPTVGFIHGRTGDTRLYRRAGAVLGAEAVRVFHSIETVPRRVSFHGVVESGAPLGVFRHDPAGEPESLVRAAVSTVSLPVRSFPTPAESEATLEAARRELESRRAAGADDDALREATMRARRATIAIRQSQLTQGRAALDVELHGVRIGPAALVGAPMEVFGALGASVAAHSPFAWTAVSGYTNGNAGYLPTPEAFDEGGYEVDLGSPFTANAGSAFTTAAADLLHTLSQE